MVEPTNVGGGAATLVDDLLDFGVEAITVVDLSPASLEIARQVHSTPAGIQQRFAYALLRKR